MRHWMVAPKRHSVAWEGWRRLRRPVLNCHCVLDRGLVLGWLTSLTKDGKGSRIPQGGSRWLREWAEGGRERRLPEGTTSGIGGTGASGVFFIVIRIQTSSILPVKTGSHHHRLLPFLVLVDSSVLLPPSFRIMQLAYPSPDIARHRLTPPHNLPID